MDEKELLEEEASVITFVDENGDLLFARRGEFADEGSVQKFVEENNVRFSLSFGPVMIENGENLWYAVSFYVVYRFFHYIVPS